MESSRMPAIETMLQNEVRTKFGTIVEMEANRSNAIAIFKQDTEVVHSLQMLAIRSVNEVICGKMSVHLCSETDCAAVIVVDARSSTAGCCQSCYKKLHNAAVSKTTRQNNYYQQIAHDSRTKYEHLTREQLVARLENCQKEKRRRGRKCTQLEGALKVEVDFDEKGTGASSGFLDAAELMIDELLKDEKCLRTNLKNLLSPVFDRIVEKDKNTKKDVDIDENDKSEMVDMLVEMMLNTSLKLNGKSKQCRYSPVIFQVAQAVWSTSTSAFKEMVTLMPNAWPGVRQMQRHKTAVTVKDGRNAKPYLQRLATKKARGRKKEKGLLQVDEMKLKHGVYWNTQTGEAGGLANDMLDMDTFMTRLLSEEGNKVEAAVYVNQWQYVAFGTDGNETWACEHFFNNGSLTGETLARQYNQVVRNCESISSEVYGVCLDAGGNNARFVSMVSELKRLGTNIWIDDEQCYAKNVKDPSRRIYFWYCCTHLFKSWRGQLLTSSAKGKKAFKDKYDTNFGWNFVRKMYDEVTELKKASDGKISHNIRLCEKVINPKNQLKMSVSIAKRSCEHNTMSFGIGITRKKLGITADALENATATQRAAHPYRCTVNSTVH